jgi:hypothetical protein
MRVGFLFSGLFWGVFLVLLGVSVLLKALFHIDIPVFRVFFALFLIFFGIKVLLGGSGKKDADCWPTWNTTSPAKPVDGSSYEVVFGKRFMDLGAMDWNGENARVRLQTVFAHTVLKLSPAIPTVVKVSTAFASAQFPDDNAATFGDYVYRSRAFQEGKPCVTVKASVVFGVLEVSEPKPASP